MTAAETSNSRNTKINASKSLNFTKLIDKIDKNSFVNENENNKQVPIIFFYKSQSYRQLSKILDQKKSQENQKQLHKQLFIPTKQNIYLETNKVCISFSFFIV